MDYRLVVLIALWYFPVSFLVAWTLVDDRFRKQFVVSGQKERLVMVLKMTFFGIPCLLYLLGRFLWQAIKDYINELRFK
jgi:hypothetical protein